MLSIFCRENQYIASHKSGDKSRFRGTEGGIQVNKQMS